jgi:hypothetical protein
VVYNNFNQRTHRNDSAVILQQLCKFVNSQLLLPMAAATGTEPAVMIKNGRGATAGGLAGPSTVVTDPEDVRSLPNFERRSKIRDPLTFVFWAGVPAADCGMPQPYILVSTPSM